MILDLAYFIKRERPHWQELEKALDAIQAQRPDLSDLKASRKVLSLFQRACSDLARIGASNAEPELRTYLETLVGRGYAEIHSSGRRAHRFTPLKWFLHTLPQTFRRHIGAFAVSVLTTVVGMFVGGVLLVAAPEGREVALAPFPHVAKQTPSQRVAEEEKNAKSSAEHLERSKASFSGMLMQHNTKVSISTLALGLSYGVGTAISLFYNGVILGAVCLDYILDGQIIFLIGWLLPHGSFEIPAILIAGQAGFVLARALIGWGTREGLRARMREVTPDLATLIGGVALMLVWAGFVEAFFSQYHEPVLPYWVKIAFGSLELAVLVAFYAFCGRKSEQRKEVRP